MYDACTSLRAWVLGLALVRLEGPDLCKSVGMVLVLVLVRVRRISKEGEDRGQREEDKPP